MSFIGIVAGKKNFEMLKRKIEEQTPKKNLTILPINIRSLENVKNIKFEIIVLEDNIQKFKEQVVLLEKLYKNTSYIVMNTDKNQEIKIAPSTCNITYGLNQKAMVTVSSITDTDILVYWQKSLPNRENIDIEIEEKRIKRLEKSPFKTYDILILYILLKIYNETIIDEI